VRVSPIILAVVLSLSSCDNATSKYATLDDARKDRLFERGWLPDILPVSTLDIQVSSELGTNHADGEFSFEPAEFAAFTTRLHARDSKTFEYSDGKHT